MDKQITFGSLFAGIGGFDLGFERAGMTCEWQVEIDDYATRVLQKHWPNVHRERDIRECGRHNLTAVDVICGGFPCQDISYAGLGAGLDGERSGLFFEAVRLVCELRPRAVVLENVAALLTRGLDRVVGTLAEIGYDCEWHCIPAAAVGAPHIRDRVFIIAYLGRHSDSVNDRDKQARHKKNSEPSGTCGGNNKAEPPNMAYSRCELRESRAVSESSGEVSPHRDAKAKNAERCGQDVADTNCERLQRQRAITIGTIPKLRDTSNKSWWAVEPAVGRVANGVSSRVDRLRGLGNAVVPQVAEIVGNIVLEKLSNV